MDMNPLLCAKENWQLEIEFMKFQVEIESSEFQKMNIQVSDANISILNFQHKLNGHNTYIYIHLITQLRDSWVDIHPDILLTQPFVFMQCSGMIIT